MIQIVKSHRIALFLLTWILKNSATKTRFKIPSKIVWNDLCMQPSRQIPLSPKSIPSHPSKL